ncbi:colicin-5-like [Chrysoperla carnea]|uniref:colicin-5-like n=1 Tax=Chrysoperla carnea TaxID=189513 RepID=UPI001D097697|nr:colicin-5-like [Chrysoperla carnea]
MKVIEQGVVVFSALSVEEHENHVRSYAVENGFTLDDAVSMMCEPFFKEDKPCPVCGKIKCKQFTAECKQYSRINDNKKLRSKLLSQPLSGLGLLQRFEEFNSSSPLLLQNLKENGIPLNNKNINRLFDNDLKLSQMFYRNMPGVNGFVYIRQFSGSRDPMLDYTNNGGHPQWIPGVRLALHALLADNGSDNINNFPEMKDAITRQDFNAALKSFYAKMTYTQRNFQIADIFVKQAEAKGQTDAEINEIKDATKTVLDFYKEVFQKYGDKAKLIAEELATAAKGKQIRNVEEAMRAFDKYKDAINKKFSVADRQAIARAVQSLNYDEAAKNLRRFSKAFGVAGTGIDAHSLYQELRKASETGDWRPFFVKAESIAAGMGASVIVGIAFSFLLAAGPLGIFAYGAIMVAVGAMVNEERVGRVHDLIFN